MARQLETFSDPSACRLGDGLPLRLGQLLAVTADGKPLVDFPGNPFGPVEARSALAAAPCLPGLADRPVPVLLVFENEDPTLPIVVGFVQDRLPPAAPAVERPPQATLDGKTLVLEAKNEIVLRCGKSSITLTRDGKIVILGSDLVSRASGINKIKGAAVKIN
jgi:hypothetical protein